MQNTPHFTPDGKLTDAGRIDCELLRFTRSQLESYMIDCHGFDAEQLAEWDSVDDLRCDIRSFGWAKECVEYLS